MNVDLGIWDKLSRLVVFLLFLAALFAVVVWYLPLIRKNERARQLIAAKELQVRQEDERTKQLESAIRSLRSDPRTVERLARERLGYIKPGEIRIQFEPPATNYPGRR